MAATANPSPGGNSNTSSGNNNSGNSDGGAQENGNGVAGQVVMEHSAAVAGLRHNPGLSTSWTPEEQKTLETLLQKYASDKDIVRYAKISIDLRDKTVRDVALRCRWMSKKENCNRRKDDSSFSRKNKDKKEKPIDSLQKPSPVANLSSGPPYAQSIDSDDGVSFEAIGGPAGQLLEQSAHAMNQISTNFSTYKIHENIGLFSQARTNILKMLNEFNDAPDVMKQMPPLPVKLNEELANSILGRTSGAK